MPIAPTNLSFTTLNSTAGILSWQNNNPISDNLEHLIFISSASGVSTVYDSILATNETNSSSIFLENLISGVQYCFNCVARNSAGESQPSLSVTGEIDLGGEEENLPGIPYIPIIETYLSYGSTRNTPQPSNEVDQRGEELLFSASNFFYAVMDLRVPRMDAFYLKISTDNFLTTVSSIPIIISNGSTSQVRYLDNIIPNTTYYFKTVAENQYGSTSSTLVTCSIPNFYPNPTNLVLTNPSPLLISATWDLSPSLPIANLIYAPDPLAGVSTVVGRFISPTDQMWNFDINGKVGAGILVLDISGGQFGDYGYRKVISKELYPDFQNERFPSLTLSSILIGNSRLPGYVPYAIEYDTTYNIRISVFNQAGTSGLPTSWASATITMPSEVTGPVFPPAAPKDLRFIEQTQDNYSWPFLEGAKVKLGFIDGSTDEDGFEVAIYINNLNLATIPVTRYDPILVQFFSIPPKGLGASGELVTFEVGDLRQTTFPDNIEILAGRTVGGFVTLDSYLAQVRAVKYDPVTGRLLAASPTANVSGSTNTFLEFETSSFVWNNIVSALDIVDLASGYDSIDYLGEEGSRNVAYVSGKILDPFSSVYGPWYGGNIGDFYNIEMEVIAPAPSYNPFSDAVAYYIYGILSSTNGYYLPVGRNLLYYYNELGVMRPIEPINNTFKVYLKDINNTSVKLRARKGYNYGKRYFPESVPPTLGPYLDFLDTFSSGIERTISIGNIAQKPSFLRGSNFPPDLGNLYVASANVQNGSLILKWSSYTNASSLKLYSSQNDFETLIYSEVPATGNVTEFTVTGHDFNYEYYYKLLIQNSEGSLIENIRVDRLDLPITSTGSYANTYAVENVILSNSSINTVSVTWDNIATPYPFSPTTKLIFNVWQGFQTIFTQTVALSSLINSDIDSVTLSLPQTGGSYFIYIYGENDLGQKTRSVVTEILMRERGVTTPTNFRFTGTSRTGIQLTWDLVPFATSYRITRTIRVTNSSPIVTTFIVIPTGLIGSFADTSLIPDTTVEYSIESLNSSNQSSPSNTLSYSVPDGPEPPIPPSVVDAPRACSIQGINPGNVYYRVRRI